MFKISSVVGAASTIAAIGLAVWVAAEGLPWFMWLTVAGFFLAGVGMLATAISLRRRNHGD